MSGNKQTSSIEAESTIDIDFIFEDGAAYPSVTDDGEYVAYVNQETNTITAREVATDTIVEHIEITDGYSEGEAFGGTAFSPDRSHFSAVVRKDDGDWRLLLYDTTDIENWHLSEEFRNTEDSRQHGTAFSRPNGDRVTMGDTSSRLHIFDVDTWELTLTGSYYENFDHDFSDTYFAQTSNKGVYVDESNNIGFHNDALRHFEDGETVGLSFSAGDMYLAYVANESSVVVRDTETWEVEVVLDNETENRITDVAFVQPESTNKLVFAVPEEGVVYLCDPDQGWDCSEVASLDTATLSDQSLAATWDDSTLIVTADEPVDIVGYPDPGLVNDEVTFEVATDVSVDTYEWDFGDGTQDATAEETTVHTYDEPDTYTVTLTAQTTEDDVYTDEVTVTIQDVIAEFTVESENLAPGPEIVFDASDSESDNPIDRYEWSFTGDDEPDAKGERVTHVFEEVGEFEVTLEVTDEEGSTDTVSELLSVERELWRVGADDQVQSSLTVVDGTVYVGSNDGSVYALDALTGEQHWEFETGGEVHSSPNVVDGTVYVGSSDNHIYALDADTEWDGGSAAQGNYEWRFDTGGEVHSSPTVLDGRVYVASNGGYLYALAANPEPELDGVTVEDAVWEFELTPPDRGWGSAVVQNGHVYALDETKNRLVVLNMEDGSEEWSFEPEDGSVTHSPAVADETVYVAAGPYLYAVAAEQEGGTVETYEWRFEMETDVVTVPTVGVGLVYVGTDSSMYAIDVNGGGGSHTAEDEEWRFEPDGDVGSSPTVAGDVVYFGMDGSADSDVSALDATDGSVVWQTEISDLPVWSAPTVAEGVVYVGSLDEIVYALGAGSHTSSEDSRVNLGTLGHTDTWADRATPDPLTLTAEGDIISDPETEMWNLSLSGTQVDRIIIDRAWLKWGVEEVTATEGAVPNYPPEVEPDSTLTLEWGERQSTVSLDVALSPPADIYVGGEYRLQVIAERGSEMVDTEIVVEIREET